MKAAKVVRDLHDDERPLDKDDDPVLALMSKVFDAKNQCPVLAEAARGLHEVGTAGELVDKIRMDRYRRHYG